MLPLDLLSHLGYSSNPVGDLFKAELDRWVAMRKHEGDGRPASHLLAAVGHRREVERLSAAARFLSGRTPDDAKMSVSLHRHEPDVAAGVLMAHSLPMDRAGRAALDGVVGLTSSSKSPQDAEIDMSGEISAVFPEGEDVAAAIDRARSAGSIEKIDMKGVHSKGMMLATDPQDSRVYLIKPGSGPQSPAAGERQSRSTQSQREAAFWHAARVMRLEGWLPRADLVRIGDREVAVTDFLPRSFRTLEEVAQADGWSAVHQILAPLRTQGVLHMWGAMDFILGQTDRHWGNVMSDDGGVCRLIDEGSAFSGTHFDPTYDRATYVPCYLRYAAPTDVRFNQLKPGERRRYMSLAPESVRDHLDGWIGSIDVEGLRAVLSRYGIDSAPVVGRLDMLRSMNRPLDEAVVEAWVSV